MKPIDSLSFQLYSARLVDRLDETFDLLAGIGYRLVEPFGGLLGKADEVKRLMGKHGMKAPTAHVGMDRLRADAKGTAGLCRDLGIEIVFAPAPLMGEREGDAAHWRKLARELAGIGKIVTGEGLKFGWHNHHWEYTKDAGKTYLEMMFEEAPDLLWQADLAWIIRGGGDPLKEIEKHAGRLVACHVKDIAPQGQCADEDGWADPGHGTMDWGKLVPALRKAGVKYYVAEHDKPNDVARFARRAHATVASWQ